jgi:hypothetical protein
MPNASRMRPGKNNRSKTGLFSGLDGRPIWHAGHFPKKQMSEALLRRLGILAGRQPRPPTTFGRDFPGMPAS